MCMAIVQACTPVKNEYCKKDRFGRAFGKCHRVPGKQLMCPPTPTWWAWVLISFKARGCTYHRTGSGHSTRTSPTRQKDYPRGHSAKPGGVAIGSPCPAGLSISATNSLDINETLDARVFLQGFRICRYQGCNMAWCEAL